MLSYSCKHRCKSLTAKIIGKYARMEPHSSLPVPWTKFNLIAGAIIPAVMKYVNVVYATDKRWDSREAPATHLAPFFMQFRIL